MSVTQSRDERGGPSPRGAQSHTAASLARRCWQESANDPEQAIERMAAALLKDRKALAEMVPALVRQHCRAAIASEMAADRARAFYGANPNPPAAVARLRAAVRTTLLDFPLPVTGKRLADATGEEAADAARHYRAAEGDARRKARWLEAVATAAGPNIIGDVLSLAQLERMREDCDVA